MTRKTKYVLLGVAGLGLVGGTLILCAAFVIGVGILAAQVEDEPGDQKTTATTAKKTTTENKLYKKSDVDGLVKFHEWVAEVKFTAKQRERFESFLAKDFERDAAKARKDTDDLIKVHEEIRGKGKDVQELTRQILAPIYIEDFRKKKSDPFAKFMLGVYEKTGDDRSAAEAEDETASIEGESEIAPDLIGKWTRNEGSSNIDPTGKTKYKSGADFEYEFSSDGTVKYSMKKEVLTILQCEIEETKTASGTASASGETLTLNLGETNFVSSNSCEEADNFDKNLPAGTVSLRWRLKTEYETTRLCLEEADGEQCYDKLGE